MSKNPYEVLSIETTFLVDEQEIQEKAHELLQRLHPDLFIKNSAEAAVALEITKEIHESVSILTDPLERAKYLMNFVNTPIPGDEGGPLVEKHLMVDALGLHEQISETQSLDFIDQLHRYLMQHLQDLEQSFDRFFQKQDKQGMQQKFSELSLLYAVRRHLLEKKFALSEQ